MSADWEMSRSAAESRTFPIVPYFAFVHIFIQFLSFMKLSRSVPQKKKKKKMPVKGGGKYWDSSGDCLEWSFLV